MTVSSEVVRVPDHDQSLEVSALIDRTRAAIGHLPLSEGKRRALRLAHRHAGDETAGAGASDELVAAVLVREQVSDGRPPGRLVGYAQIGAQSPLAADAHGDSASGGGRYAVELVVDPTAQDAERITDRLLSSAIDTARRGEGREVVLWVHHVDDRDEARARRYRFSTERTLLQLRCPLPLDEPAGDALGRTRAFVPGRDEQAWLEVNNRAFVGHPEQGNWTVATLAEREREPWFDPDGLRVLEVDGRMVGSCWTKVHRGADPALGEIYVIGVHPAAHGRGYGRLLTRAGLGWLAERGLRVGMLYVDGENRAAIALYRSLGFVEHHADRAYRLDLGQPG